MKRLLSLILASLLPAVAFAQSGPAYYSGNNVIVEAKTSGEVLILTKSAKDIVFGTDTASASGKKWEIDGSTGNLISSSGVALVSAAYESAGDLVFKADSDAQRLITLGAASDVSITQTWGDGGTTAVQDFSLMASTADADDDSRLNLCGGGAVTSAQGACISISGNEDSVAGDISITTGAASGSGVQIKLFATNGTFAINNSSDVSMWDIDEATGKLRNLTGGGDLSLSLTGTTLAIQEATAGSACSGTLTLNGATPVVTSTTCATAGSRIFLTRTSIDADTTGDMAVTALSAGVSFSVTSEANDTATVNWFIVHEAA